MGLSLLNKDIYKFYSDKLYVTKEDITASKNPIITIFYKISVNTVRIRFFDKQIEKNSSHVILDVGCGGGRKQFKRKGKVIGMDVSIGSLKNAKKIYDDVILADATILPFKDKTFDYVISSDLIGHIDISKKDILLIGIQRILKSNGKTLHFIETEGQGVIRQFAKKYIGLYRKYFIELDGHIGLESPSKTVHRFKKIFGCEVLVEKNGSYIWSIEEYVKRFDNEYRDLSMTVNVLMAIILFINYNRYICNFVNFFLGIFLRIDNIITPLDNVDSIFVKVKKENDENK